MRRFAIKMQFIIACLLLIGVFFGGAMQQCLARNLTSISWAHAVNSQALLNEALSSDIDMIEADIVLGTLIDDEVKNEIPIMGHPPANTGDLSLEMFLNQILEFNNKTNNSSLMKGVKLDFKSTPVFQGSRQLLREMWPRMNYPVWLNADILSGPVNNTATTPVDASEFLAGCKDFPESVLSIGWTTRWGADFTDGQYTTEQVQEMIDTVEMNNITDSHSITFPVRAGIAANSFDELKHLYTTLNDSTDVTLTIWSSQGDYVNIDKLQKLILDFGVDKVYLDVPEEVSSQLDLSENSASSYLQSSVGVISIAIAALQMFLMTFTAKH